MATIHFLNVLEGDCNIIQHDSGRVTVMDVSNGYNDEDTEEEKAVKASKEREEMRNRTFVPSDKKNYYQKKDPDNPIDYLKNKLKVNSIFRFIISHPDMDHLDGIKDLFDEFEITNTWDTDNDKYIDLNGFFAGYNKEDWKFYTNLRAGKNTTTKRLTYFSKINNLYFNEDDITILCPTAELVKKGNETEDYNDSSYAILFTPPKKNGGKWKILLAGDTHDDSWDYILKNHKDDVSNIDILFAPHHGRDSSRNYDFLKTLTPSITLFGNASSEHLAYTKYTGIKITNNQAGHVIFVTTTDRIEIFVKNFEFAKDFRAKNNFGLPTLNTTHKAYSIGQLTAK
jgi:beta-lactamase superfamily II metal-dependent hydrolase